MKRKSILLKLLQLNNLVSIKALTYEEIDRINENDNDDNDNNIKSILDNNFDYIYLNMIIIFN